MLSMLLIIQRYKKLSIMRTIVVKKKICVWKF